MNISFRKISRGPAWERWLIVEDQRGDTAFAGEIVMTFADTNGFSDVECDILFVRELDDEEVDELMKSVVNILSGQGNITLFTARQIISKDFSLMEGDDSDYIEGEDIDN